MVPSSFIESVSLFFQLKRKGFSKDMIEWRERCNSFTYFYTRSRYFFGVNFNNILQTTQIYLLLVNSIKPAIQFHHHFAAELALCMCLINTKHLYRIAICCVPKNHNFFRLMKAVKRQTNL